MRRLLSHSLRCLGQKRTRLVVKSRTSPCFAAFPRFASGAAAPAEAEPAEEELKLSSIGTSPYDKISLARDWDQTELEEAVAEGYRHPKVDVAHLLQERDLDEALAVFNGFKHFADAETWSRVLWAHARTGNLQEMSKWYFEMTREHNLRPTVPLYSAMVKAMTRAGAHEAVFKLYEEEIRPREYIRLDYLFFKNLFKACAEAKRADLMEKYWVDFHEFYARDSADELWTSRVQCATACNDWPLILSITEEMDAKSKRLRAFGFRALVSAVPTDLPSNIEKLRLRLFKSFARFSEKRSKGRRTVVFFQSQLDAFELVKMVAKHMAENK